MAIKSTSNSNIIKTHRLANGETRESMKGYKVPVNDKTIAAYRILARYIKV